MKVMYGLFRMTYDYYEWENLWVVSDDMQKLVERHKDNNEKYGDNEPLAVSEEQHKHYALKDRAHYIVRPVEVV